MRILTVRQPWAWAIIGGGKDVENRVRNIAGGYRGPVAIHAGLAPYEKGTLAGARRNELYGGEDATTLVFGAIIGVVDLVDVHAENNVDRCIRYEIEPHGDGGMIGRHARGCTRWAEPNMHHLVLANPRPLRTPIPYKGALGLRTLDDETAARVLALAADVENTKEGRVERNG